ncbi:unnamed protein product, partial [Lampetra fluviatilis]
VTILHPHWRRAAGHVTRPSANHCARIRLDESRLRWEPRPLAGTNHSESPGSRDRGAGGEVHHGSPSPPPPVLSREEPQCIVGARRKTQQLIWRTLTLAEERVVMREVVSLRP